MPYYIYKNYFSVGTNSFRYKYCNLSAASNTMHQYIKKADMYWVSVAQHVKPFLARKIGHGRIVQTEIYV